MPLVSVIMPSFNHEKFISIAIENILNQTFADFEYIIIDDASKDKSKEIIRIYEARDSRIHAIFHDRNQGISKTSNDGLKMAKGKYVFFTDSDCQVSKDWIEQGLKSLLESDCIGVEGKTYYVSEDYEPTYSDAVIRNENRGQFMTCNMAYKRSIIRQIGGFDERYTYLEDRDLAMRAMRLGRICFNPEMIVLGGGVIDDLSEFMIPVIKKTAIENAIYGSTEGVKIVHTQLGNDAGILGAAALAMKDA